MKKSISILLFLIVSFCGYSQQDLKEKYKDYTPCIDCAEQWNKFNASTGNSINLFKTSSSPKQTNPVSREAKQQVGIIVKTVAGIFVSAIAISIYTKANKVAYGAQ